MREKEAKKENVEESVEILDTNNTIDSENRGTKRRDRSLEKDIDIDVLSVNKRNSPGPSRQSIEGVRQKRKKCQGKE